MVIECRSIQAEEKLGCKIERFVLAEDGTEVDEDELLEEFSAMSNNNLTLVALRPSESFGIQYMQCKRI